jgi:hypothetical protein
MASSIMPGTAAWTWACSTAICTAAAPRPLRSMGDSTRSRHLSSNLSNQQCCCASL